MFSTESSDKLRQQIVTILARNSDPAFLRQALTWVAALEQSWHKYAKKRTDAR